MQGPADDTALNGAATVFSAVEETMVQNYTTTKNTRGNCSCAIFFQYIWQ